MKSVDWTCCLFTRGPDNISDNRSTFMLNSLWLWMCITLLLSFMLLRQKVELKQYIESLHWKMTFSAQCRGSPFTRLLKTIFVLSKTVCQFGLSLKTEKIPIKTSQGKALRMMCWRYLNCNLNWLRYSYCHVKLKLYMCLMINWPQRYRCNLMLSFWKLVTWAWTCHTFSLWLTSALYVNTNLPLLNG